MTSARRQPNPEEEQRARPREADIVSMPMPQQQSANRPRETQMERIGDILRRTRERRGDDLQAIADYLCIRRAFLEALEGSRYEEFPADAYVVGFLRSYAELIGLDSRKAIDLYRSEMAGRRKKPSLVLPTPIAEGRSPSMIVLIGAVIAAILVYVIWYGLSTPDRATVSMAPALPSTPATEGSTPLTNTGASAPTSAPMPSIALSAPPPPESMAPAQPAASSATSASKSGAADPAIAGNPADAATAPEKPPHLVIKAIQSSWVLVSEPKGKTLFDRVLKPGETFVVPEKPGLTLTTGNGEALVLVLDGVDLPKLTDKPSSGIMRDISLDTAHLKAKLAPKDKD